MAKLVLNVNKQDNDIFIALRNIEGMTISPQLSKWVGGRLRSEIEQNWYKEWHIKKSDKARGVEPYNVYSLLKKAMFGNYRRGHLTGSTKAAIRQDAGLTEISVGIPPGKRWPMTSDNIKIKMSKFIAMSGPSYRNRLERQGKTDRIGSFNRLMRATDKTEEFKGDIEVSWNTSGFRVTWPKYALKRFGLGDMNLPSEPFENKHYGMGKKAKDFFRMSEKTADEIFGLVCADITRTYIKAGGAAGFPDETITDYIESYAVEKKISGETSVRPYTKLPTPKEGDIIRGGARPVYLTEDKSAVNTDVNNLTKNIIRTTEEEIERAVTRAVLEMQARGIEVTSEDVTWLYNNFRRSL